MPTKAKSSRTRRAASRRRVSLRVNGAAQGMPRSILVWQPAIAVSETQAVRKGCGRTVLLAAHAAARPAMCACDKPREYRNSRRNGRAYTVEAVQEAQPKGEAPSGLRKQNNSYAICEFQNEVPQRQDRKMGKPALCYTSSRSEMQGV
eukprot:2304537-Pleurochrysis_carterae.AAC.1